MPSRDTGHRRVPAPPARTRGIMRGDVIGGAAQGDLERMVVEVAR
jgi:hypothetical protein